jgi:hypothetical protein
MMKLKALDFIYNFHSDLNDPTWLKKGTIMIIKEPYLKFSPSMTAFIRVDSPSGITILKRFTILTCSDVVFVRESDKKLEKLAPKWYVPEKHSFDMLKRKGNELFVARDYEGQRFFCL